MLVTGELYPTERSLLTGGTNVEVPGEVCMEGVEHLGQYVYEMSKTKVRQLQAEGVIPDDGEMGVQGMPQEAVEEVVENGDDIKAEEQVEE